MQDPHVIAGQQALACLDEDKEYWPKSLVDWVALVCKVPPSWDHSLWMPQSDSKHQSGELQQPKDITGGNHYQYYYHCLRCVLLWMKRNLTAVRYEASRITSKFCVWISFARLSFSNSFWFMIDNELFACTGLFHKLCNLRILCNP